MSEAAVSVVEYGIGNIQSVANACRRAGRTPLIARSGTELREQACDRIILPGVGAVGEAMRNIRERGLDHALNECVIDAGTPLLGICVGMQVLASVCEEFGEHRGLGWIEGRVRRMAPEGEGIRLPHVGWNDIAVSGEDSLLEDMDGEHFYFQHSYAMEVEETDVIARADYHGPFTCGVRRNHIAGVQFHPEKSSDAGRRLLAAFFAGG